MASGPALGVRQGDAAEVARRAAAQHGARVDHLGLGAVGAVVLVHQLQQTARRDVLLQHPLLLLVAVGVHPGHEVLHAHVPPGLPAALALVGDALRRALRRFLHAVIGLNLWARRGAIILALE